MRIRLLFLLAGLWLAAPVSAAPVKFDIPAQPAADALKLFARQASVEVLFPHDEMSRVRANTLQGEFEIPAALDLLLQGTGYAARRTAPANFVVTAVVSSVGTVRGTLIGPDGRPAEGVTVRVKESLLSTLTDRSGSYSLTEVPAGRHTLAASGEGYQPLHITEVNVRSGREIVIGRQVMRRLSPVDDTTQMEPFVVQAGSVAELDPFEVTGVRVKPFTTANVDLPRTINDAQPYTMFDAAALERAGVITLEDFLKQRLTMNTVNQNLGEASGNNTSAANTEVNLRGLGADKTLILVNGRRLAGARQATTDRQVNLGAIPLNSIERVEVLPSSASGIYGGSAIGGVINIILKKSYAGGELRLGYENIWDTDAPLRSLNFSYGLTLEGGRTHVNLAAAWKDSGQFRVENRRNVLERGLDQIRRNDPNLIGTFPGALPNIQSASGANLVLKAAFGGGNLGSDRTTVPSGLAPTSTPAQVGAALLANAGRWNFDLAPTNHQPTGLHWPFNPGRNERAFNASIRRQMLPRLEIFVEGSHATISTVSEDYNPFLGATIAVAAASPINPFTTNVNVAAPIQAGRPRTIDSESLSVTVGAIVQLPFSWTAELDYGYSKNWYDFHFWNSDTIARTTDLNAGTFNPFVDLLQFSPNHNKYLAEITNVSSSWLETAALRGAGPLPALPWGEPSLIFGLDRRWERSGNNSLLNWPLERPTARTRTNYFPRNQDISSVYAETKVPLARKDVLPFVHQLELQLSGRSEQYDVTTGPASSTTNLSTGVVTVTPSRNGQPFFSNDSYTSSNYTVGVKYEPVAGLILRASTATAFLPPAPNQLVKNPDPTTTLTQVNDPILGTRYGVPIQGGGNPDLKPQSSESRLGGIVWQPTWSALQGVRLSADYYRISQFDAIGSLNAQAIVDLAANFPGRVTRDAANRITLVDTSFLNLFKRETEGWDFTVSFSRKTSYGNFSAQWAHTTLLHLKSQISLTLPETDAVGIPAEGGAAKHKSNLTVYWERGPWSAGWTVRYFGAYRQFGVAGGPTSVQFNGGAADLTFLTAQGSEIIPAQTYHDLLIGHDFGRGRAAEGKTWRHFRERLLDGLSIQIGMKNVFDKVPPVDVFYSNDLFLSPYEGKRLRSYWITVRKLF